MYEDASARLSEEEAVRRGFWPSVGLAVAIAAITWLSIGAVFGLGQAGISALGGVGPGSSGLLVWAALWIAMWAATTLLVGSGLAAAFGAWKALYPTFDQSASRATVTAAVPSTTTAPAAPSTLTASAESVTPPPAALPAELPTPDAQAPDTLDEVKRLAIEEAEALLRRDRN
jgi:hypothetical protein